MKIILNRQLTARVTLIKILLVLTENKNEFSHPRSVQYLSPHEKQFPYRNS